MRKLKLFQVALFVTAAGIWCWEMLLPGKGREIFRNATNEHDLNVTHEWYSTWLHKNKNLQIKFPKKLCPPILTPSKKKKPAPKPASPLHKQKGENLTENNQKFVDFCNATKI